MKIAVDIDGTVCDFSNKYTKYLAEQGIYILNKDIPNHMDKYAEYEATKMSECFDMGFYAGSEKNLYLLHKEGNELTFLTKRASASWDSAKSKIETLTIQWQKYYFSYFTGVVFAKRKEDYAHAFDIAIEDDPINANAMSPLCQVILLNRGWNREAILDPRVIVAENWDEVYFILHNLNKFKKENERK